MTAANKLSFTDGVVASVSAFAIGIITDTLFSVLLTFGIIGALFAALLAVMDTKEGIEELIGHIIAKEFIFLLGFGLGSLLLLTTL